MPRDVVDKAAREKALETLTKLLKDPKADVKLAAARIILELT